MSGVRRKILENLDNRVHPINEMCTLSGTDYNDGLEELQTMRQMGLVELVYFLGMPMYNLTCQGRDMVNGSLQLVVDNDPVTG